MDNDGDPADTQAVWDRMSIRGAMGIVPLRCDPPATDTSFNWWSAEGVAAFDWGPSHANGPNHGGLVTRGSPTNDADRYVYLNNGEIDYDQLWSGVDLSDSGWVPPPSSGYSIAAGRDTRFVYGFGRFDLQSGDSVSIAVAFVAGDNIHQLPTDFEEFFDSGNPQAYYDRLDFGDLVDKAQRARQLYDSDFYLYGAAPLKVQCEPLSDSIVRCHWSTAPFKEVSGYRIYRRSSGDTVWTFLRSQSPSTRRYDDANVQVGQSYEYAITAIDTAGYESPKSKPASITVGKPLLTPHPYAHTKPRSVEVSWSFPQCHPEFVPSQSFVPIQFVNVYRRTDDEATATLYRRFTAQDVRRPRPAAAPAQPPIASQFVDSEIVAGTEYLYSVSSVNALGIEGDRSPEIGVTPLALDRDVLVIFTDARHYDYVANPDSVHQFYTRWADRFDFDTVTPTFDRSDYHFLNFSMQQLARYKVAVVVLEEDEHDDLTGEAMDWLDTYLSNGGQCIIISRNTPPISFLILMYNHFGVYHINAEGFIPCFHIPPFDSHCIQSLEFRGANAVSGDFDSLDADSVRAWDNRLVKIQISKADSILGNGIVPLDGTIDSIADNVEVLYTYVAGVPDTSSRHGKPIATKLVTDTSGAILFHFPLSVMEQEPAMHALSVAVAELGIDTTAIFPLHHISPPQDLIDWLYGDAKAQPDPAWDMNHDGRVDVVDAVLLIDWDVR